MTITRRRLVARASLLTALISSVALSCTTAAVPVGSQYLAAAAVVQRGLKPCDQPVVQSSILCEDHTMTA